MAIGKHGFNRTGTPSRQKNLLPHRANLAWIANHDPVMQEERAKAQKKKNKPIHKTTKGKSHMGGIPDQADLDRCRSMGIKDGLWFGAGKPGQKRTINQTRYANKHENDAWEAGFLLGEAERKYVFALFYPEKSKRVKTMKAMNIHVDDLREIGMMPHKKETPHIEDVIAKLISEK